jgi:hypothetical protein
MNRESFGNRSKNNTAACGLALARQFASAKPQAENVLAEKSR